jgi:hypothetical protein
LQSFALFDAMSNSHRVVRLWLPYQSPIRLRSNGGLRLSLAGWLVKFALASVNLRFLRTVSVFSFTLRWSKAQP